MFYVMLNQSTRILQFVAICKLHKSDLFTSLLRVLPYFCKEYGSLALDKKNTIRAAHFCAILCNFAILQFESNISLWFFFSYNSITLHYCFRYLQFLANCKFHRNFLHESSQIYVLNCTTMEQQ
jgi:hypothetical protein